MNSKKAFDWDSLRYFLELSRAKKLVVAAPRLGVEYTTVSRRIAILEEQIGSKLFEQTKAGYLLTDAGRALLTYAEKVETIAQSIQEELAGIDFQSSGVVRLGATEGLGTYFLARHLWMLNQQHPGLRVDLIAVPRFVNLSDREADIAITIERPQEGRYIVTKLTDYSLRLHASSTYLASAPTITDNADLAQHPFVDYIDDLLYSRELCLIQKLSARTPLYSIRSSSLVAQLQAIKAGAGIGMLPSFMTAGEPDLRPVLPQSIEFTRTFWLVTREDIFHLARIKAVWNFIRTAVDENHGLFLP